MPNENHPQNLCFLALPAEREFDAVRKAIIEGAEKADFQVTPLDQYSIFASGAFLQTNMENFAKADCIIADITEHNPNAFFAVGLAQGMGKGVLLVARKLTIKYVPYDLREFRVIFYDNNSSSLVELSNQIDISLREYLLSPRRSLTHPEFAYSIPFFIWERLGEREKENLCRELLTQMGFQQIEWDTVSREFDLVAELPRKDPDGFEYRELWLISMGLRAPMKMLSDAVDDPEYFIRRILRYSGRMEKSLAMSIETPITLLLILFHAHAESEELNTFRKHFEKRRFKEISLRLRIWDHTYLNSLIHRFPQIGYKCAQFSTMSAELCTTKIFLAEWNVHRI